MKIERFIGLVQYREGRDAVIVASLVRLKCVDANLLAKLAWLADGDVWPIATAVTLTENECDERDN